MPSQHTFRSVARIVYISFVVSLVAAFALAADENKWSPPEPSKTERDWILLTSGEWLWGTIELMRDESLVFDSEELDEVTIDWDKISEIRSARILTYVMRNGKMLTGTSVMKGSTLLITSNSGLSEVPRSRIYTILAGKPTELNFWSIKLSANINIRSGNTNQYDLSTRTTIKREASRSRIDLRHQANFSERESVKSVDNQRVNAEWKIFLSRLFFVTPIKAEILRDAFQNIDSQYTVGPGVGYFLKRTSKTDWYVELTAASQGTEYDSVLEGEAKNEKIFSLPMRTSLDINLTSKIELQAEYSVQIGIGEGASSTHRSFLLMEFDLFGDTDFNASVTWDHVTKPKTNADNITPKRDDVAMAYGISIKF